MKMRSLKEAIRIPGLNIYEIYRLKTELSKYKTDHK